MCRCFGTRMPVLSLEGPCGLAESLKRVHNDRKIIPQEIARWEEGMTGDAQKRLDQWLAALRELDNRVDSFTEERAALTFFCPLSRCPALYGVVWTILHGITKVRP